MEKLGSEKGPQWKECTSWRCFETKFNIFWKGISWNVWGSCVSLNGTVLDWRPAALGPDLLGLRHLQWCSRREETPRGIY